MEDRQNKSPSVLTTSQGLPEFNTVNAINDMEQLRPENYPTELHALVQWVLWKYEHSESGGKPRKVPYDTKGRRASSTRPDTWDTLEQVQTAYLFGDYAGIGFVLDGDGIVGVDIDHCIKDGVIDPNALALLDRMNASYIEFSPSGTGLRALGYGPQIMGTNGTFDGINVELYSKGRYLTMTGHTIKIGPLNELHGFADLAAQIRGRSAVAVASVNDIDPAMQPPPTDEQLSDLRSALKHLVQFEHGENYLDWSNIGHALKAASRMGLGERANELRELFIEYSRNLPKFEDDEKTAKKWEQLKGDKSGIGAVFKKAQELGWINPRTVAPAIADANRYKVLTGADLRNMLPMQWRVKDVLPAMGLAQIFGPSKSGKSFLAIGLACAICEGREWFGHRVKAAPVIYLALEGEAGLKQRVGAWEAHNERALPEGFGLVMQPFNVTTGQDIADLGAVVPVGAVVFIDTLSRAMPGLDENSGKDMGLILQGAKLLADRCQGLVILVHHTGKDDARGARGHSSLTGALDGSIWVKRAGDNRSWSTDKVKEGKDGGSTTFTLLTVPVGIDEDGDVIKSCVVEAGTGLPVVVALSDPSQIALDVLKNLLETTGVPAPKSIMDVMFVDALQVVSAAAWRAACYASGMVGTDAVQDTKRKAFKRAMDDLIHRDMVRTDESLVWLT